MLFSRKAESPLRVLDASYRFTKITSTRCLQKVGISVSRLGCILSFYKYIIFFLQTRDIFPAGGYHLVSAEDTRG